MVTFTYGRSIRCQLAADDCTLLGAERVANPPLDDVVGAMRQALARPTGYPSLAAATAPGDRVAVMVGEGLPQAGVLVRGALVALEDAGVDLGRVTVVSAGELDEQSELARQFSSTGGGGVQFEKHDPDDQQRLAMIGVTRAGEPLRLNRTLAEADFVLPIGLGAMPDGRDEIAGRYGDLYLSFSSRETSHRLHAQAASESPKQRRKSARQSDEAGWLAGVAMTVRVVRGAGDGIAAVLAGEPETVAREAAERSRLIWERPTDRQGKLVIGAIAGDERQQTWENVAKAIAAALPLMADDGAIAVCSELRQPPAGPFKRLKNAVDYGEVSERLAQDDALAAGPARVLAQALDMGPVYLRSRLPAEVVESLGVTPIDADAELSRLAAARRPCVIIEEAQRLAPRLVTRVGT
ncbi:MAG: hypothetical protein DCC67_00285 [Planctomycetota bacterium]|nr:MAG: hypothetical protein DCC67_00285 [Planctomycetota bacterium]